ncbi:TonB family protein [Roseivirga sp. BDSF3-8]|uniref:M56 family metallopeptidase n=1 Tax=Roseivirga sp. BDSF3-8 TaxID=3241598 RepID=UPI0035319A13
MITNILPYLAESLLCGIIFLVFYRLVLAGEKSFSFNRFYLLGSLLLMFLLPLLHINTQAGGVGDLSTIYLPEVEMNGGKNVSTNEATIHWGLWVLWSYLAISAILFIRLVSNLTNIMQRVRKAESSTEDGYRLVHVREDVPVSTFFHYIFWPQHMSLSTEEQSMVLKHEITHVKQWHTLDLLLVNTLASLFWILPVWKQYRKAFEETHEYLADREVLRNTTPQSYGSLIAKYTLKQSGLTLTHSFANQSLKRITMMKNTLNSIKPMKLLMAFPLAAVMFWTVSCEESDVIEEEQTEQPVLKEHTTIESEAGELPDDVLTIVDEQPMPEGGFPAIAQHIQETLKYPGEAEKLGIEGRVYVQFIVNTDGSISNVKAIKGIGHGCDAEAIRVVSEMPHWNPGIKDGETVKVRMVLPIVYKL